MAINFRRAYYKYASNEQLVTYIAAADHYQTGVPQLSQQYYYGAYDPDTHTFPNDTVAFEYYDAYLPTLAIAAYNTAFGASETVGIVAPFNPDTVRADIKVVADALTATDLQVTATHVLAENAAAQAADALASVADVAVDLGELQDELSGITTALSNTAVLSDFQTGVTLTALSSTPLGAALPTTLPLLTILGDLVTNVNTTNARVNDVAARLILAEGKINALIAALESKTILTP